MERGAASHPMRPRAGRSLGEPVRAAAAGVDRGRPARPVARRAHRHGARPVDPDQRPRGDRASASPARAGRCRRGRRRHGARRRSSAHGAPRRRAEPGARGHRSARHAACRLACLRGRRRASHRHHAAANAARSTAASRQSPCRTPTAASSRAAILDALQERGLRRVLVEGGAQTVSTFLSAGCLDRLHLTVAPMILGSGVTGLDLPPIALRVPMRAHTLGSDVLFDCDLRSGEPAGR